MAGRFAGGFDIAAGFCQDKRALEDGLGVQG